VTYPFVLPPTWHGDLELLADEVVDRRISLSEPLHKGMVWDLRRDTVQLGDGQSVRREFVVHPGAVGVIAIDDADRVLMVRQYRHPVGMMLWEPVAGLLDVADESPEVGAARELVEEAGIVASTWHTLIDMENSPGGSSEAVRCYLARGLSPAPEGRPIGHGEERDMPLIWVPLELAVRHVLAGRLSSPLCVAGVLAAALASARGWSSLRPVDAPWPARLSVTSTARARLYHSVSDNSTA